MINNKKYNFLLGILCFVHFIACARECEWFYPNNKVTTYLFAPGIHSSERQIAKYCEKYISSTEQLVYTKNDFTVINNDYATSINFSEIILDRQKMPTFKKYWQHPYKWFTALYHNIVQRKNYQNDFNERFISQKKRIKNPTSKSRVSIEEP